ncbi:hypothetical protein O181_039092 [Austropuccinia psidii MF-1]|uniref:Reverse transcriptase Ty1/copia-type domain-containing protein n=1 Tax=Austropuccinia psidii MF-1 TaxID=1389203 RepID=A0A9Q3HCJ6_9BASI|nr:hypothetical protein [Austropuccinia psidii MF-1]
MNLCIKKRFSKSPWQTAPYTYHEAMVSCDCHKWEETMEKELRSLRDMGVWESASNFNLKQALGCHWVYTVKKNQQGNVTCYKAELVVQGHQQIKELNFDERFALTLTFNSLQFLLTIVEALGWEIQMFDVTTAYLHSNLKHMIYVRVPQGATDMPKVLYGLKQAGRCWWNHLQNVLKKFDFQSNPEDPSTYTYNRADRKAILWVHIDDGVIGASSEQHCWHNNKKTDGGFELCQLALIRKLCSLDASNITASQPLPSMDLVSGKARTIDKDYLSWIGMILYVAQATSPDIMYAVNFLARFSMNTTDWHWMALDRLINYVQGTSTKSSILRPSHKQDVLNVFVDANWGGRGSRSQHGYVGLLWGAPIMWNSKKHTCISLSTCQAEYIAMLYASKECLWIGQGLIGIAGHFTPTLLSDNKAAIQIAGDSGSRKNSRQIRWEFHLKNELLMTNQIKI